MSTTLANKAVSNSKTQDRFRQTRHEDNSGHLALRIKDIVIQLKNWSRTGLGFECSDTLARFEVKSQIQDVKITYGDITIYEGAITIERAVKREEDRTHYGASFPGGVFITESIDAAMSVSSCANKFNSVASEVETANPDFCRSVLALNAALRIIKDTCEQEQLRWRNMTYDQRCEAERIFIHALSLQVKEAFTRFNIKIAKQVDIENLAEGSIYHRVFHEEVYPYFENSDIIRRAYEKPRGYAGDFEMMNQIYRDGFEGPNLFGRVLHHYIINEHSGESVKFRKPYFYSYYQKLMSRPGTQNVLSVACGPAVEFQEVVQKWSQSDLDRLNVTLFDLDREALEHSQTKIYSIAAQQGKNPNVTFINASVKSFLTSAGDTHVKYDLIYSGGLFDYLDNTTSAALVRKFFGMLNPGGYVIIGNFTKDNMTKAYLHLLANWSLIHKTESEMRNWAAGIENCSVEIEFDRLKMNAFLVLKRNAD
jgi:SAM-dependent methyltransferase